MALSPWPIGSPLVDAAARPTPVWQRWLSALRDTVTSLEAGGGGGGGGGDADTLDGLDRTDFMRKPMPATDLPLHHARHEPGGVDALQVSAASRLVGRGDSGAGAVQEIALGTGLALSGTTLSATGSALPGAHHTTHEPGGADAMAVDAAAATGSLRTLGAGAQQAAPGNDARLTNARTPTAHAATHSAAAADPVTVTALAGYPGGTTTFLRADGTFATPGPGAPAAHHLTHEPGGSDPLAVDAVAATGSLRTLGTGAQQAASGTDSRFTNARTPTAHATTHQPGGSNAMAVDAVAATGSLRTLGTGATQAAPGNDARFTAAPQLHKTTHQTGGTDLVDVKLLGGYPGGTANFLRADGTFAAPPTGGIPSAHHATHEPGGSDALLNVAWTNLANTFTTNQTVNGTLTTGAHTIQATAGGTAMVLKASPSETGAIYFYNNAVTVVHTALQGTAAGLTIQSAANVNGLLTVSGFGTHTFSASGAGANVLAVANPADGPSNFAQLQLTAGGASGGVYVWAPSYASTGANVAQSLLVYAPASGGLGLQAADPSGVIRFYTGGASLRATLAANGHWGLNTAPDALATAQVLIDTTGGAAMGLFALGHSDAYPAVRGDHASNSATGYCAFFFNTAVGTGQFLANSGAWVAYSDRSLKTDIRALDVLARLRQVQPRDFLWKTHATSDRPGQRHFGFVAQEVEQVFPDLVTRAHDGKLGLAYTGLIAPLVSGWQDHDTRIAALEARMTDAQ